MWMEIDEDRVDYEPDLALEDLEFEYPLPKGFWSMEEWYWINQEKRRLRDQIKDRLSMDVLYLQSIDKTKGK